MSQIFHRSANTISRLSIFGAVFIVAGLLGLTAQVNRSPWVTGEYVAREQPIQFSHERHVGGNGIDCRDCHRHPEQYVRPRDAVFRVDYQPPANQRELGARLVAEYEIQKLTSCSTCHR